MPAVIDVLKLDLYAILGIDEETPKKEIVRAYRKKARQCHPDKNPDNPKAAEEFHKLSQALEILTDAAAKAAYDKVIKAKKAAQVRHKELDVKRKKFKEDLEARERTSQNPESQNVNKTDAELLAQAIDKLRKEGSKLLEEEQQLLKQQMKENAKSRQQESESKIIPRLKAKWPAKKGDPENGGYSQDNLHQIFSKYGEVIALVASKKNGSAIIEYSTSEGAHRAVKNEHGLATNPLILTWISGEPPCERTDNYTTSEALPSQPMTSTERDFESVVLMRMRQAEERKRLIDQIQKEDETQ